MSTENGAIGHSTTESKCLDLFSLPTRGYDKEKLLTLFDKAFAENPHTTLKILYHLRDPRNGKGEKELTLVILHHMLTQYPENYKANLDKITSKYGCYKMLCELYARDFKDRNQKADIYPLTLLASYLSKGDPLAGKWAPSEHGEYNHKKNGYQASKLCHLLKLVRDDKRPNYATYRKLLTPLRTKANIVEQLCCSNRWDEIEFQKVASRAMMILSKKAFPNHCGDKFEEWKRAVKAGKSEVKATGIHPHEIVNKLMGGSKDEALELQWNTMVKKVKENGNLSRAIAMSDVSGSMYGGNPRPIDVSIALGIFISEVCANNQIMTFSNEPKVITIKGDTLIDKIKSVKTDCMGFNTDFVKALMTLLNNAKLFNVKPDQMPLYLFVLSDMEFDQADLSKQRSPHEVVKEEYESAGYTLPKIIYWNLACRSGALPVTMRDENTALVSGFSQTIMKAFLELNPEDAFNPISIMEKILESYDPEVVQENNVSLAINNQVSERDTTQQQSYLTSPINYIRPP